MCVLGGWGVDCLVWSKMLSFCHRMISDPNQSPSDILSDVLLRIILSPAYYNIVSNEPFSNHGWVKVLKRTLLDHLKIALQQCNSWSNFIWQVTKSIEKILCRKLSKIGTFKENLIFFPLRK